MPIITYSQVVNVWSYADLADLLSICDEHFIHFDNRSKYLWTGKDFVLMMTEISSGDEEMAIYDCLDEHNFCFGGLCDPNEDMIRRGLYLYLIHNDEPE